MTSRDQQTPDRSRLLRSVGLAGTLLFAVLAALFWFGADVLGTKECLENGYGLAVEGGGSLMTEEGCELTVPTTSMGKVSGVLPTLNERAATTALVAALAGALPPSICLWLATRRTRELERVSSSAER